MNDLDPPIEEVVAWVARIFADNCQEDVPMRELSEHVRELFYERKKFWYGITSQLINKEELAMGLSQHAQTWITHQLRLASENEVVGVYTEENQDALGKIISDSLAFNT